ncbi:MAG TPA: hypothetical protein VJS41_03880 [Stellaceae bacterium]|nr:hypothetical protein [Stellaceae bacterium]
MNSIQAVASFVLAAVLVAASVTVPVRAEELGSILGNGQSVGASDLAAQRGGTAADQTIDASQVATVNGVNIGANLSSNSFGGFGNATGIATAVQNTGNNVAIQTEVVVNISLH